MAFRVRDPDVVLSPFTGMTRRHWVDAATFLLEGVFRNVKAFDDPIVLPRQHAITYPQPNDPEWKFKAQEFEGLARTFMLAAPLIAENPELAVAGYKLRDYYANQLVLATDPKSPRYLLKLSEIFARHGVQQYQHTVEGGALAIGLNYTRGAIWDRFTDAQRDQVAGVLSDYAHNRTIGHNWRYFNVLMLSFLRNAGYPADRTAIRDHIQNLLAYYVGDGWYRDDETFDYYNPWGFHFYGPIWCSWYGYRHEPEAAARIEEWNAEFIRTYPRFFSRMAHQLMWGRSIIYRCAASAAFGASFMLERTAADPGWCRRVASGNLLQFLGREDVFLNGVPCLGYFGPFAPLVQFYSCAASPFWISKAFLALTLPAASPFWTARESEGPWTRMGEKTQQVFLKGPGILVANHGSTGTTEIVTAKAPKRDPFYAQLAYNTHFVWEDEAAEGATAMTYSIRESETDHPFRSPLKVGFQRFEKGVLYRQANTKPSGLGDPNKGGVNKGPEKIDLADIVVPGGVVRVDRVRLPYKNELHLAHYGLPHLPGAEPVVATRKVGRCAAITCTAGRRSVALVAVRGWDGVAAMPHKGRHPEAETSTVVYAHRTRRVDYGGMEVLVTVLLHRVDGREWTNRELNVVRSSKPVAWTRTGSPCGLELTLTNGATYTIDFGFIEAEVVY
jgi:hypothetical protein